MKRFLLLLPLLALAQDRWTAQWIAVPDSPAFDYGVYHFRRTFDLPSKPAAFSVHVTADNRYVLFVNGERVGLGPARGDLNHWRYETYDIAGYLKAGRNVLAAVVWNAGIDAPIAQITNRTGFLLAGPPEVETGRQWKCIRDEAYTPEDAHGKAFGYYAVGPTDRVDGARYPWGWQEPQFDDSGWKTAVAIGPGALRDMQDAPDRWMLVPRPIPMEELKAEAPAHVRGADAKQVPAHSTATVLLDQQYLTTGYPELTIGGGKGATVTLGYAESLYLPGTRNKGNRDEVEGKEFHGYQDVFIADGGMHRTYRPLWWRTWRYLELKVVTGDEPLTIERLSAEYTGYPFLRKAHFEGGPEDLQRILDVGWRTARLCAHETYMDCPYYEQLQYVGDTRIQALVSLYMTGDGRLMRNAIEQIDSSRTSEGATYSRAPSRLEQYIPTFSLWWIGMLHDYWMYQDDPAFVRSMLPGVRAVLSFFAAHQESSGSLGRMPWWNFVDWASQFRGGVPPMEAAGSSALLDLQLLLAYDWAAHLEAALGSPALWAEDRDAARKLRLSIQTMYWEAGRRMYADTPSRLSFSQHTQSLAVLAGLVEGDAARDLIARTASDPSLVQATIYFRHYLHSALNAAGEGDHYLDMLGEWRAQLARGMTTWAESPEPSRSDCHAWGASPNFELFRTVLGIDSAAPGFKSVLIRPFLGKLDHVSGAIPHPKGEIAVSLDRRDGKLHATVSLPPDTSGDFVWEGRKEPLHAGTNTLVF
ncbi:MAG TPA: alpha-L-rhamnosidase C-terminal domain-containing protein [Bryobacteraceae bacterium]|nr:alpha-L-rhamnosidase C-terminal domain-containing protein [Bryobacteraceae bacterium]